MKNSEMSSPWKRRTSRALFIILTLGAVLVLIRYIIIKDWSLPSVMKPFPHPTESNLRTEEIQAIDIDKLEFDYDDDVVMYNDKSQILPIGQEFRTELKFEYDDDELSPKTFMPPTVSENYTNKVLNSPSSEINAQQILETSMRKLELLPELVATPSGKAGTNILQTELKTKSVEVTRRSTPATTKRPTTVTTNIASQYDDTSNAQPVPITQRIQRLVHLDLKGAPPKFSHFELVFPLFKKLGATGLLIEYEDMFPYSGDLNILASPNAYSREIIQRILKLAKDNSLMVIPLIQTFGHMEFVLKHDKFKHLRELSSNPQAIIPIQVESLNLIQNMLDQVMELHPDISYFHIGCDEVYHLGKSAVSTGLMNSMRISKAELFIEHVSRVASGLKENYPSVQPIIWDDMLRGTHISLLQKSRLRSLVEPMIWVYTNNVPERIDQRILIKYDEIFPHLWIASAFKGATGINQFVTDINYHLANHQSWIQRLKTAENIAKKVRGIALTGWQRYNHLAGLCELLPVGLPSLAVNLQTLVHGEFNNIVHRNASKLLGCGSNKINLGLSLNSPHVQCAFPGNAIFGEMHELWNMKQHLKDESYLSLGSGSHETAEKKLKVKVIDLIKRYKDLRRSLELNLNLIYYPTTTNEVLSTLVDPNLGQLEKQFNV